MDDEHDDRIMEYPAWREAISRIIKDKRTAPGTVFSKRELCQLFMIRYQEPDEPMTRRESDKLELQFLNQFLAFRDGLLEEHQIAITSTKGETYTIVLPREQSLWAEREAHRDMRKMARKLHKRLTNVDYLQLTAEDRKNNADALARLGMLTGMVKQITEFKLSPPDDSA
jgi:hypothetical protein